MKEETDRLTPANDHDRAVPEGEEDPEPPEPESLPGYDGLRATAEEREQMVRDMALWTSLQRFFARRVRAADVDDFVQETLFSAHCAPNLPGGGGKERDRYVFGIANRKLAERARRGKRQVPIAHGASVDRAVQAADAVADRDLFAKITDVPAGLMFEMECLTRMALGHSLKEIARERKVEYKPLHKRVTKLQQELRQKGKLLGGVLALLLTFGVGEEALRRPPPMALDQPEPVGALAPAVSTHVAETDPRDWARVLRGEAFRDCMSDAWEECRDGLDAARDLDPDGESDPFFVAARKDATMGYMTSLKPGSTWRPPAVRAYAPWASR
jgi:DNA-directed RNA polymerase specialized sigma24 family protein